MPMPRLVVARHSPFGFALACCLCLGSALTCAGAAIAGERPPDWVLASGWTVDGYIDPAAGEAQRTQVAIDPEGVPLAVWAGRLLQTDPFEIRFTRFDGTAWSPVVRAFAPNDRQNQLPRLSRAPDGTLWLAWLRFGDATTGNKTLFSELLAARYVDGAWSAPETVAGQLALPPRDDVTSDFSSEFAILGVSRDEAWVVFARDPSGDPFSLVRDLEASHRTAAGWGAPMLVSDAGLSETRPELVTGPGGRPVVFFGFANSNSVLWAKEWNGATWEQGPADVLAANGIFEHAVQPDTSDAVRLVAFVREIVGNLEEDHVREFVWNASGFHPGPIILQAAVVEGGGNEPPDWVGLSLATSGPCTGCPARTPPRFRPLWIDFTPGSPPRVFSTLREPGGYAPLDVAGTALEPAGAYPNAAYDAGLDRWYAVWSAPPSSPGLRRAKFAWTQTFAGDVGIGATFVAPDTARIEIVCSGDATGREFRVFRLAWDALTPPPLAPPIPAAAVELAGSPYAGPCPLQVDERPAPGRYYYYAQLVAEGLFPADYARASQPVVLTDGPPPDTTPSRTAFLAPYPQPALDGLVSLPFDLARAAADVRITLYDLRGRLVKRIELGARSAGAYRGALAVQWNGSDDAGHRLGSSVYFARLWVNGVAQGEARRVVIVRAPVQLQGN
jgi:flagellar hook capping protein FlgD